MTPDLFDDCRCRKPIEAPQQERDANNLIGLAVRMSTPYPRCCNTHASVGPARGPHAAVLMCSCGRQLGWLSDKTYDFLSETIRRFGRLTSPIQIRRKRDASSAPSDADARRLQLSIEMIR